MGQYQTRSAKSSEEPEEVGLREAREKREVREGEPTPIPELVIGSPIDSELLLDDTSFTSLETRPSEKICAEGLGSRLEFYSVVYSWLRNYVDVTVMSKLACPHLPLWLLDCLTVEGKGREGRGGEGRGGEGRGGEGRGGEGRGGEGRGGEERRGEESRPLL